MNDKMELATSFKVPKNYDHKFIFQHDAIGLRVELVPSPGRNVIVMDRRLDDEFAHQAADPVIASMLQTFSFECHKHIAEHCRKESAA